MEKNSLGITVEGTNLTVVLFNAKAWPQRGEFKRMSSEKKLYLYASDGTELIETYANQGKLPDIFGLTFKRTTGCDVDMKSKRQSLNAIMTTYDLLNDMSVMHEMQNYND